ncbi:MAG: hypothetical protein ACSLFK_14435 [Gemmatimonadaceae bacterium]
MILDTQLAFARESGQRMEKLELLDSALQRVANIPPAMWGQLVAAQLWELSGQPERALAAVLRRNASVLGVAWVSLVREEARLADKTGDIRGAIRAYRQYLALNYDPEPALRPEVVRVRASLVRLERRRSPYGPGAPQVEAPASE